MDDKNLDTTKNESIDDIIILYQQKIIEEIGLDKLPEKKREESEMKIAELVNNRIINIILAYLPPEKSDEFKLLIEQEKIDEVVKFLKTVVPDIETKIVNDLMLLRKELISKLAK